MAQVLDSAEIIKLKKDEQWIIKALPIWLKPGAKKDLIVRWAENLEEQHRLGSYPHPITTICSFIIEKLKQLGLHHSVSYAWEVLDHKYKDPKKSKEQSDEALSSEILAKISSKEKNPEIAKSNAKMIHYISEVIETWKKFRDHLAKDHEFQSKLTDDELIFTEKVWQFAITKTTQILDGREKITVSDQYYFLSSVGLATLNDIYSKYVTRIRDYAQGITPKQVGKIVKGQVRSYLDIYDPKNQEQAVHSGFYGTPCHRCGSWRVVYTWNHKANDNVLFCFECHHYRKKPKTLKIPFDKEIK